MLTQAQFQQATVCTPEAAKTWYPPVVKALGYWQINTPLRTAGFLAQMSMETGRFTKFVESLNYSVQGLANTWPNRFSTDPRANPKMPNSLARALGRTDTKPCDQAGLANIVYGGRFGNRVASDDGWRYRGRGLTQTTFYDNYKAMGALLGLPLLDNPDLLLQPDNSANAGGGYWKTHGCNELMDRGDYLAVTKAINGGTIGYEDGNSTGLDDRVELFKNAKKALGIA